MTVSVDRCAGRWSEMGAAKHLGSVLKAVNNVPGVFDAYRVTQ
ncbi:hypothetical protein AFL01nite_03720 [Aeromicrobium flavum]|uniref:Uncharacterized protein n=1 Tax=Aeromicrobium flavum TaxID=416568 RepID=A0A512HRG6_9ACTN|nr:hypothetical protein [Aeromicrobium flavum]GEO88045.1 hypothetical protein AFL01nite_03720 [Aeromicrobium flavum]